MEGNRGWPEQDPGEPGAGQAVRGIGSPLSHSARRARRPNPGPAVPGSRVPQPPPPPTPLGQPQVPERRARRCPGARKSRPSVPPHAASPKAAKQLCLCRSTVPAVPAPSGMRAPLAGRAERTAPRSAPPAQLGRPGSTAPRARPRGAPPEPRGEAALAACSFRTRAARSISSPCRDHFWSPVWKY